ncbi:jg8320 [Pararge aegeria aegeria]|uniref:Jg8320 protein n=1 Tax=Pararge aegeria aegeria TaxID=348720 RepID=A0A8S4R1S3_9NEOP|nr:jg8320 [Pararge aegeria aegeria]
MPYLAKSAAEGPLGELDTIANQLFQEAKLQLEQSGNIRSKIKETVIECLSSLYTIILMTTGGTTSPAIPTVTAADFSREVMAELQQQRELVVAARSDMGFVRDQVQKICDAVERYKVTDGVSYAEKAASGIPVGISSPVHSMVVSSVDAHDTSEDIINKIRSAVSAKTTGIWVACC